MHTIIHPARLTRPVPLEPDAPVRPPHYECDDQPQAMKITVFVPGVDAAGVDVSSVGPDLVVTARKAHPLRVNWRALHLEGAQLDYHLRLRLGAGFDLAALTAGLRDGVLEITVPKRAATWLDRQRRVA